MKSLLCNTSFLDLIEAPASAYFSSLANAAIPAFVSTNTSTFHFLRIVICSGSKDTLVSGDGSFNNANYHNAIIATKISKIKI